MRGQSKHLGSVTCIFPPTTFVSRSLSNRRSPLIEMTLTDFHIHRDRQLRMSEQRESYHARKFPKISLEHARFCSAENMMRSMGHQRYIDYRSNLVPRLPQVYGCIFIHERTHKVEVERDFKPLHVPLFRVWILDDGIHLLRGRA